MKNKAITIAGQTIEPGTIASLSLPSADLYTQTKMGIPIHVFHGKMAGPRVFITGTIHGDELNSIEIIRRLHLHKALKQIHGTLITIPIVNIYGFILQSRYLPDRRDLNRSFPGHELGSLAARLAHVLMEEIIAGSDFGIDLHTGASGRLNMPQLRVNLDTPGVKELAKVFGAPVILDAKIRDGSLREAASELGIPLLVYEGGEALRFNEMCIRIGVLGIMRVLSHLGMIPFSKKNKQREHKPLITQTSRWVRACASGLVQQIKNIGQVVKKGDLLAHIHDPFLSNKTEAIYAPFDGIIIGILNLPLVNEGDAVYHIASSKKLKNVTAFIEELREEISYAS